MAILSRIKLNPQQRLDLEDWLAEQSAARTDSKLYTQKFLSTQNLVLGGFSISGIGLNSATVAMSNAALILPQNSFDFSYFISAPTEPDVTITDAQLVDGVRNYVEAELTTLDGVPLTKAFWDPNANTGLGQEFNQIVNTITDLKLGFVTSTGGFSGSPDRIPIAIIDTNGSGVIKLILDRREIYGRLAKPNNLNNEYAWGTKKEPVYSLTMTAESGTFVAGETITIGSESATVATGGTTAITFRRPTGISFGIGSSVTGLTSGATGTVDSILEAFIGVDKSLANQKNVNDALMTEIKRMKATPEWYSDDYTSFGGLSSQLNALMVQFSAGARFKWNGTNLFITDNNGSPLDADVVGNIRIMGDSRILNLTREDGTGGSGTIAIADGEVLFVQLPTSGTRSYSGQGSGATNYQTAARASYLPNDTNFWIAFRQGSLLYVRNQGELRTGEETDIGDDVPQTLLDNIGLADEVTPPSYSSNIRGISNQSLVARLGVLTDAVGDEQEDRSAYLRSDAVVTWTGSQLQFSSDIVLDVINTKSGTITKHKILAASSPISLNDQESSWALIDRTNANETLTLNRTSITPIPAQTQANKDVIVFFRRVDASSVGYLHIPFHKQVLEPGQSVRLGASGSGSGTGSGIGDDLNTLKYKASFTDSFQSTPVSGGSTNISVGFTDPANYNAAFKYWTLNYDASKTVTGTGTAMTLSGAPAFTIKAGDALIVAGEMRRITVVTTQTSITIESAFSSNPSAAACNVSQALYTVDLNNFAGTGLPISGALSDSINEILTDYADNNTPGSIVLALGVTPNVAYVASSDGSSYTKSNVRTNLVTDNDGSVALPTSSTNLFLRFFANKSSGSGIVNFLRYKVFSHSEQPTTSFGFTLNQAYGFTDGSGAFVNASVSVVSTKTRISLSGGFSYTPAVNAGTVNGQLFVTIDGLKIPRFISATATPNQYYKEIDSTTIELDSDYSGMSSSFEVLRIIAAQDVNAQNGVNIANINSHKFNNGLINSNFDFWQRGVTFTTPASATFSSDRWRHEYDGTIGTFTITRQAFTLGQGVVPNEPSYFLRWDHTAAGSGSTFRNIGQRIESVRSYAGKQITVAFWAKADSARSVAVALKQNFGTGGSPSSDVLTSIGNASLTTSWQQFSFSVQVPSISGKTLGTNVNDFLEIRFLLPINTTMTIDLAQTQINEGPAAMPWQLAGREIREELALCQRYYEKSYQLSDDIGTITGNASNTTRFFNGGSPQPVRLSTLYKVTKRGTNSSVTAVAYSDVATVAANTINVSGTAVSVTAQSTTVSGFWVENNTNSATGTVTVGYEWTAESEL